MKRFLAFIFTVSVISSCNLFSSKEPQAGDSDDTANIDKTEIHDSLKASHPDSVVVAPVNKDSVLMGLTKDILTIFKSQQYAKLDTFIHPAEGVRFSPYATVEGSDQKFSKESFRSLVTTGKGKRVKWGSYDGSGDPIILTPNEYFKKFVYDANFVKPEKAKVNGFIGKGNSVNNLNNFYHNSDFTESYFSGSKQNGGMDWKSVRLVFKEVNGKYYLVGVVHDQWTI